MNVNNTRLAISLTSVSKKYEIHHEKPTLVEKFVKGRNETFWALRDVNLTINKGERVGIIGSNGSGKTTLLKIIAGITTPTAGTVRTFGKVVSLIDLEAGFHEDLSGIQNIYLSGMLLGFSRREINQRLRPIIAFANIRQFIDAPLFTYSEGMKLRLGFSVATHADPDILILDEAISVGDKTFQEKSRRRIQDEFKRGKTIIIASHWMEFLRKNCRRIILLDHGKLKADGDTHILSTYAHR